MTHECKKWHKRLMVKMINHLHKHPGDMVEYLVLQFHQSKMGCLSGACGFGRDTLLAQDRGKWVTKVCQIQEGKLATQTIPFSLEQYEWLLLSSDGSHLLIASQLQLDQQIQLWTGKLSLKKQFGSFYIYFFKMYWLYNNKRLLFQATYSQAGHKFPCWNCL